MISIIIPNWNGAEHIKACLDSLEKQSYQDAEVIVVDNGSDDESVHIVMRQFPNTRIVRLERNWGFAKAANEGIRIAQGDYIALLNNDTEADPHWLEELLKGMKTSEGVGLCASRIMQFDDRSRVDTAGDGYRKVGIARKRGHNRTEEGFQREEFVFGACAAAALYRTSMLNEIGAFDEDFFCLYEDVDLSFRAQLAGYRCLYVPTAIVYHRIGGTSGKDNDFTLYYGQRNLEWVFLKNMPLMLFVKYFAFHAGYVFLAWIYSCLRKRGRIFLRSKLDAFRKIRLILQKRKVVQEKRRASTGYLRAILE
jgi:GT2 family glycosyltransferase